MPQRLLALLLIGVMLLTAAAPLIAQPAPAGTCAPLVIEALTSLDQTCGSAGANQACYGFFNLQPTYRSADFAGTFEQPAAIVDLGTLAGIRGAAYTPGGVEWGIAVLRLRANIPGALPGQLTTLVLLGDAAITDTSTDTTAPMTAFQLATGTGAPACQQIPPSSLVVQSPQRLGVEFTVNGVNVRMGSAASLRVDGDGFRLTALDGRAYVNDRAVPLGFSVTADVDDSGAIDVDTLTDPAVMTFDELISYQSLATLPDAILMDDFYVPTPEELALLSAIDFDWLTYLDPYALRDTVLALALQGVTPADVDDISLDDFAALAAALLGDAFPDLIAELDATIAADGAIIYDLEAEFGIADDDAFFTYTDDDLAAFYGDFFTDYVSNGFDAFQFLYDEDPLETVPDDTAAPDETAVPDDDGVNDNGASDGANSSTDAVPADTVTDATGTDDAAAASASSPPPVADPPPADPPPVSDAGSADAGGEGGADDGG